MKTRIKEELLNFFPNYLTIVFNTVKKILFSHAYCTLKREEEARMRQLIFIERGMEKKFARKLFFPFQFQFQFYFSIINPFRPINFTKKQHLTRRRRNFHRISILLSSAPFSFNSTVFSVIYPFTGQIVAVLCMKDEPRK